MRIQIVCLKKSLSAAILLYVTLFFIAGCSLSPYQDVGVLGSVERCLNSEESVLSCRNIYDGYGVQIKKIHTVNGADQVNILREDGRELIINDCKLNGWGVSFREIVLLCYMHESNVASGRSLQASEQFNAILVGYESLDITSNFLLPFSGGIDPELVKASSKDMVVFCNYALCLEIGSGVSEYNYRTAALISNGKILEVLEIDDERLAVLSSGSTGYHVVTFKGGVEISREKIEAGYDLSNTNGVFSTKSISSFSESVNHLLYDFTRIDSNTGLSWGETNTEGRVAWAAFYYWTALSFLADSVDDEYLIQKIKTRVHEEVNLSFSNRLSSEKWVESKRYSLNRESALFMMHAGRMISVLTNIRDRLGVDTQPYIDDLEVLLETGEFNEVFDTNRVLEDPEIWGEGSLHEGWFYFRRGIDFWADGQALPFNYVSAICTEVHNLDTLEENCKSAMSYLELEFLSHGGGKWRYLPGKQSNEGYAAEDNVSINTPDWLGNLNAIAHKSYLSMDAIALLKRSVNPEIKQKIVDMIIRGELEVDIALYMENSEMHQLCYNKHFLKSLSDSSLEGNYSAYDLYIRTARLLILNRCEYVSV